MKWALFVGWVSIIRSFFVTYIVRMILYYSLEVEKKGTGHAREKARLYDKLGDLCCGLKAYPPAVKFYGKQVG